MATEPVESAEHRHLTVGDYMAIEDDQHRELIEGELRVTPSPDTFHQHGLVHLGKQVQDYIDRRELGEYFYAPFDIVLSDDTVVQPDFVFVATDRFAELYDGHALTGAPDFVVEVLSPGTERRDRIDKRRLYGEVDLPWIMLVGPREQYAEVFRLNDDGQYVLDAYAGGEEALPVRLFDDLEIALEEVWFEEPDSESVEDG
jgi:Uma2 family endonuclease